MGSKKNYPYLTFLRVIAIFSVVAIHTICTPISSFPENYSDAEIKLSVFFTTFFRLYAVPIFLMISGSLFLDPEKNISYKDILSKYFFRIIICLIVFSLLFCFMESMFLYGKLDIQIILTTIRNAIEGNSWAHMWYLYMLSGLYLLIPLLKVFINNANDNDVLYIFIVLLIFIVIFPSITSITGIKIGVYLPISSVWLFYFILGYMIHSKRVNISMTWSIVLIVIPIMYSAIGIFIPNFISVMNAELKFTKPDELFSVMMSTGVFSFFSKIYAKENTKFIELMASLSFGIYLIHNIFINIFYKVLKLTPKKLNMFFMWIIVYISTLLLSSLFVWLMRRIKVIRKII